jgi:hypothetical protein
MSDDSNAPADLSSIGIDLSQIFRPSWTVESSDSTARLAAKYDEGDRPERFDRQGGPRRSEGRGGGQSQNRGPRPERDRNSRGPRPQGAGGRDAKSGGQRGSRDRDPRDRRQEERRPEPAPKPVLEGWTISLTPEHSALEAITKQIRSRAKSYPLFELARLVVKLSDRYSITLKAESETSPSLFQVKTDKSIWTSRKAAISHLLSKHLEKFYRRTSITVEAPKGSYSVVAQCGMSGVLLGPPNHHEYQSRLIALHSSRFKNLPFEVYKTRIRMMRDEALMEQWKTEQSTRTVFTPIDPSEESIEAAEVVAETAEKLTPSETVETAEIAPSDAILEETAAEAVTSEEAPTAETEPTEASEEAEPSESLQNEQPSEELQLSLEEATEHFQKTHAENEVEQVASPITVPGRIALHESDPQLHDLLIKTLQELDRFPLPLAQVIGKELTSGGLQIFKAQKKIIHVSVARPRYLDRATTPTSAGVRSILDYLEAHPKQPRNKQWAGLLALRTEPAGDDEAALKQREQALGTDLLWLLHQGHVIDFAMGNLQAALRPVQQQKPGQTPAPEATAAATDSTSVEEAPLAEEMVTEEIASEEPATETSTFSEEPPAASSEAAVATEIPLASTAALEPVPEVTPEPPAPREAPLP